LSETAGRPLFDAYVFVDWSGRNAPSPARPQPDTIWVAEYARGDAAPCETYCPTRQTATDYVFGVLCRHVLAGRRILVGFDFPYGYPAGLAAALGLDSQQPAWLATWTELTERIRDAPDNRSNRFQVAADLNARLGDATPGPFWGCPAAARAATLRPTSPGFDYPLDGGRTLARLRLADRRVPGVQEVWKLMGAGSVGSQALLGIPRVHWLRQHPDLRAVSRVWPFETGFTPSPAPAAGPFILHAEVWPGILPADEVAAEIAISGAIRDQAQVRLLCRWAADLDAVGQLGRHFDRPDDLQAAALGPILDEEGWILGERLVRRERRIVTWHGRA
jgi:hypothetical protein